MQQGDIVGLAVALIAVGGVFYLLTRYLLYLIPGKYSAQGQPAAELPADLPRHEDGLIIIQPGGRVHSVNARARQMLSLGQTERPNLEAIAKRIRPTDAFLGICAEEGQGRFILEGRTVECTSFDVPLGAQVGIAVALRMLEQEGFQGGVDGQPTAHNLQLFTELSLSMAGSLDLSATLKAIQASVEKFIPANFYEIALWNEESETLAPYRFLGEPGSTRKPEALNVFYQNGQGVAGAISKSRQPVMVADLEAQPELAAPQPLLAPGLRSVVGVPLLAGKQLVATLVVGSVNKKAFQQDDLALLMLLSGQAGLAIHNALRYQKEQRRTAELLGLAQLTQAIGMARDPKSMFTRLVESIAPLFDVNILGFLIFNETTRTLEGQEPFQGFPNQFVEIYRVAVPANSSAEQMLLDQDVVITENAAESLEWERLGLDYLAKAASLRDTVLVPLNSGGRMLGFLQASNHRNGSAVFTQDEMHLLRIISNQCAPIIENATLVLQARQRAQRAEALRKIAALVSSAANLEEILKFSIQELSKLLGASEGGFFLLDNPQGKLRLHQASLFGAQPDGLVQIEPLSVEDPQFHFTVTGESHSMLVNDLAGGQTIVPYYQRVAKGWGLASFVVVPLLVKDEGIGEIWLGAHAANQFDQADVQVVATAAVQIAAVIEQSYLSAQTDDSLRRQVNQLTALTRISRELSTSLDLNYLVQMVFEEALRNTQADCGTILLFDLERSTAEKPHIRFWVGDAPPATLGEIERRVLNGILPEIVEDLQQAGLPAPHAGVASALIAPVVYQQRPAGLIMLHSQQPHHFDQQAVEITQSLASQAAVALGNALQYEEQTHRSAYLKREVDTLSQLFLLTQKIRSDQPIENVLAAFAEAIREVTPFQVVLVSLYQPETGHLRRVHGAGMLPEVWDELRSRTQPWKSLTRLLQPAYQVGSVFFIPADQSPLIPEDMHTVTVTQAAGEVQNAWNPDDFLLIPLYDAEGNPMGLFSLDAPANGMRPDRATLESLELFSAQACVVIENYFRRSRLEHKAATLEQRQQQVENALELSQRSAADLEQRNLSQALDLRRLNSRLDETRSGLAMSELANQQTDLAQLFVRIAEEIMARFHMQAAVVAEKQGGSLRLLKVLGEIPPDVKPESLFGQRNPLRQALQEGKLLLNADLDVDKEWSKTPLLKAFEAKSFIALPFAIHPGRTAGILAMGQASREAFGDENEIFAPLMRQISVSAQNLYLTEETQQRMREVDLLVDYTRRMQITDPKGILQALVETALKVIPAAHSGWVAVQKAGTDFLSPQVALGLRDTGALISSQFALKGERLSLPARVFLAGQVQVCDVVMGEDYALSSEDLLRYRKATGGSLPVSSLVVPLQSADQVLGVLVLDNINTSGAFGEDDQAIALSLAQQAALGLQNATLYAETRRLTQELEQRVEERTRELRREHNNTQTLLRIITELSASLEMDLVLNRTLAVLNESLGAEESLIVLSQSAKTYRAGDALFPPIKEGQPCLEKDIAKWVVRRRVTALVEDISQEMRWKVDPANLPAYRSLMAFPLILGEEVLGALLLFHRQPGIFLNDLVVVGEATARQMAIALNNAELFNLIRDQAENLGGMLRQQQMEASRSRAILESVADGVLVTDAGNAITLFNDSAETILGMKAADLVGQPLEKFGGIFGRASQVWLQTIQKWSQAPEAYTPGESYAERLELENGRIVAINLAAVIYRSKFLATVTIFRDITHEVQVERLKSEFVANVSHELRTPMTSIKGYVEIMLMGAAGEVNAQQKHFLEIVKSNTERMNRLVEDLLDVSRIEAGRIVVNFKTIDLVQIAQETLAEFQRRSKEDNKPMQISLEAPQGTVEVQGDALRLRQVMSNMISNGYNYTPAGGHVLVRLSLQNGEAQVDVVDDGIGITSKVQKRIFERFFRGEDPLVLSSAGTGLGLAISKTMIEMHHGRIWFTSAGEPGKGSTFSFVIPVHQPEG